MKMTFWSVKCSNGWKFWTKSQFPSKSTKYRQFYKFLSHTYIMNKHCLQNLWCQDMVYCDMSYVILGSLNLLRTIENFWPEGFSFWSREHIFSLLNSKILTSLSVWNSVIKGWYVYAKERNTDSVQHSAHLFCIFINVWKVVSQKWW